MSILSDEATLKSQKEKRKRRTTLSCILNSGTFFQSTLESRDQYYAADQSLTTPTTHALRTDPFLSNQIRILIIYLLYVDGKTNILACRPEQTRFLEALVGLLVPPLLSTYMYTTISLTEDAPEKSTHMYAASSLARTHRHDRRTASHEQTAQTYS